MRPAYPERKVDYFLVLVLLLFAIALNRWQPGGWIDAVKWSFLILWLLFAVAKGKIAGLGPRGHAYGIFLFVALFSTIWKDGVYGESIAAVAPFFVIAIFSLIPGKSSGNYVPFCHQEVRIVCYIVTLSSLFFINGSDAYVMGRFVGWIWNANALAGFASVSVVFAVFDSVKRVRGGFLISLLSMFVVLGTQSRGALAAVLIGVMLVFFVNWDTRRARLIFTIWLIGGVVVASSAAVKDLSETEFDSGYNLTVRKVEGGARADIIGRQMTAFLSSPLVGVGAVIDKDRSNSRQSGEMSYVDLLATSGIIGSTVILAIILTAITRRRVASGMNGEALCVAVCILILAGVEGYLAAIGSVLSIYIWSYLLMPTKRS